MLPRLAGLALLAACTAVPAFAQEPEAPSTRDLARINWMELREWVPDRSATVLLPTGTLEAHGVTANGADILAPVAMAAELAPRLGAFVAPAIPHGFTGSMDAYPGAFTGSRARLPRLRPGGPRGARAEPVPEHRSS